jgi:hypothetical protein
VIYMPCSLQSTWNKPHQPPTKIDDHIAGEAEAGTTSTTIGEVSNGLIDCFCHWLFDKLTLPAMLAWMVAPKFTSDAAIRFKSGRRTTE